MAKQHFDPVDVDRNKVMGGIGYLFILFLVPLLACNNSRYARYCANQGLLLTIVWIAVAVAFWLVLLLFGWVPLLGWLLRAAQSLIQLALGVASLYYAYLAAFKGDARELPVIGSYLLIR